MTRHSKNRNPTRCPQCGCLVEIWPERSSVCYGCLIQREPQREQRYILSDAPVETVGAITSRHSEPQEETNAPR